MLCETNIKNHLKVGITITEQSGIALKTTLSVGMEPNGSVGTLEVITRTVGEAHSVSVDVNAVASDGEPLGGFSMHRLINGDVENFVTQLFDQIVAFFRPYTAEKPLWFGAKLGWKAADKPVEGASSEVNFTGQSAIVGAEALIDPTPWHSKLKRVFSKALEDVRIDGGSWNATLDVVDDLTAARTDLVQVEFSAIAGELPAVQVLITARPKHTAKHIGPEYQWVWMPKAPDENEGIAAGLCVWLEQLMKKIPDLPKHLASIGVHCSKCTPVETSAPEEKPHSGWGIHELELAFAGAITNARTTESNFRISVDAILTDGTVVPNVACVVINGASNPITGVVLAAASAKSGVESTPGRWVLSATDDDADGAARLCAWIEQSMTQHPLLQLDRSLLRFRWRKSDASPDDRVETAATPFKHIPEMDCDLVVVPESSSLPTESNGLNMYQLKDKLLGVMAAVRKYQGAATIELDVNTPTDVSSAHCALVLYVSMRVDGLLEVCIQPKASLSIIVDCSTIRWRSERPKSDTLIVEGPIFTWIDNLINHHERMKRDPSAVSFIIRVTVDDLLPNTEEYRNVVTSIIAQDWDDFSRHLESGLGYSCANNLSMSSEVFLITPIDRVESGKSISVLVCADSQLQGSHRVIVRLCDLARGSVPVFTTEFSVSPDKESIEDAVERIKALVPVDTDYLLRFNPSWQVTLYPGKVTHAQAVDSVEADSSTAVSAYAEFT